MASREVVSSVTGVIFELPAKSGDAVAQGDVIAVVESMKMEIAIVSPCAGRLASMLVAADQPVDEGQVIAIVEA